MADVDVSGTATDEIDESEVVSGEETIILTLTDDTWVSG